jgi:hypothetical protein
VVANVLKNRVAFISKFRRTVQHLELLDPCSLGQCVPCNAVNGSSSDTSPKTRTFYISAVENIKPKKSFGFLGLDPVDYKPSLIWESLILFNNYTLEFAS